MKAEERENDEFYVRMMARSFLKMGAGYAWISKFDEAVNSLTEATKYKTVFNEREIVEIQNDIDRIKVRQRSNLIKQEGDIKFSESNLDEALVIYEQCLELDPLNEYVMANIGLIYMMK